MTEKRCKFELVKGGWIGDDKVQKETIVCYDNLKNIKYHFTIKCIGEYEEHNEKELERLTNLLNQLLSENKLLKDNKNISDGMRLIRMTENKRFNIKPSSIVDDVTVIIDDEKKYSFPILDSTLNYMFCKALNELSEENQSSKEFIEQLQEELVLFKEAGANTGIDLNAQITALKQENEKLKNKLKFFYELNKPYGDIIKENEQLKQFIDDLTTKGTGRIDLANGYSYSVSAVLTNWKGDME